MQTTSLEAGPVAAQPWFGLRVRSRSEQMAVTALEGKGYQPFLPVYKVARRWTDRVQQVEMPLFPGYVFCRFDPQRRLPILITPGVVRVLGFGKVPAPIDEEEINAILAVVNAGLPAQPWPFTREGDKVAIRQGPLRGIEGVVGKCKNNHRLILSVTMLQRSVSVEIDPEWAERIH
jgi:transcriptional antiterminator RfaH